MREKVTEDISFEQEKEAVDKSRRFQISLLLNLSIVLCVVTLLGNVVLSLSMMQIASSLRVDSVVLARQNSSSKLVDVEPVSPDMNNIDTLNEVMVKRYIIIRHNILGNVNMMSFRWDRGGLLQYFSTPEVYQKFYVDKNTMKYALQNIANGTTLPTEVEFTNSAKLAGSLWKVNFDTIEYDEFRGVSSKKHWVASVTFRNEPRKILYTDLVVNPLGFVVVDYDVKQEMRK